MQFELLGTGAMALWLADGNPDFSVIPAGTVSGLEADTPVRLHRGTPAWGEHHIETRHKRWALTAHKSIPELVWHKLGSSGLIYVTETESKLKISLKLSPSALLVVTLMPSQLGSYFSVTTLYQHPPYLDGKNVGRYKGRPKAQNTVIAIPPQ